MAQQMVNKRKKRNKIELKPVLGCVDNVAVADVPLTNVKEYYVPLKKLFVWYPREGTWSRLPGC